MQAFTEGALNFDNCDPADPIWNRQLSMVMDALARSNNRHLTEVQLHLLSGIAQAQGVGSSGFGTTHKQIVNMYDELLEMYYHPFAERRDPVTRMVDEMSQAWVEAYGDPKDPAVAARIDSAVDDMLAIAARNRADVLRSKRS